MVFRRSNKLISTVLTQICINKESLNIIYPLKILEVVLDVNLTFKEHAFNVTKKI